MVYKISNTYIIFIYILEKYWKLVYNQSREVIHLDIRTLEYFLAVAREENITRAAKALNMTQPPLSREIKALEEELGKQLFVRGSRKVTLTEEGMILRRRAEELVMLMEKTKSEVAASNDQVSGDLHIGGGETYGMEFTAETLCRLYRRYPGIRVHLHSGNAYDLFEKLENGILDFALVIEPADLSKYDYIRMPYKDIWGLLMRKDHPLALKEAVTPDDLDGLELLVSRQSLMRDGLESRFRAKRGGPVITATYNLIFNASLLVKSGMGCALCLERLVPEYEESLLTFRPFTPRTESGVSVIWKKYQVFSKPAAKFLEVMQEVLSEAPDIAREQQP